jgi:molecular chaperone DnaK
MQNSICRPCRVRLCRSLESKAVAEAKEQVKDGDNLDAITTQKEALSQASLKIGQAIYSKGQAGKEEESTDDNTMDADYKEKTEDKEEKKDKKQARLGIL